MAKGLRASTKKANRTALRSRVFAPVENARLERLHQKLLEAAQQPKPENSKKNDMDLDAPESSNDAASNEEDFPKGSSHNLAAVIPSSFLQDTTTPQFSSHSEMAEDACINDDLFLVLGLGSDIVGFTPEGRLEVTFDSIPTPSVLPSFAIPVPKTPAVPTRNTNSIHMNPDTRTSENLFTFPIRNRL